MPRLTAPSDQDLERLLLQSRDAELLYPEVGATRGPGAPAGYRFDRYERSLGSGEGRFERAFEALHRWRAHVGAGVRIYPGGATAEVGATVLFVVRTLGLWLAMPCRVVYSVEDETKACFAYGTLPRHPERGEVAMTVSREADGSVLAVVESFSRTVDPLARLVPPVTRAVQTRVTKHYLEALEAVSAD